jgi:hypothetical protein
MARALVARGVDDTAIAGAKVLELEPALRLRLAAVGVRVGACVIDRVLWDR